MSRVVLCVRGSASRIYITIRNALDGDTFMMGDIAALNGNSNMNGHANRGFKLKNVPVENFRPMRVVVVGAGFSGILAAIRIPEKLRNVELAVYERNEGIGGVWYVNSSYPYFVERMLLTAGC